jgi:hypothetical protein
MGSVDRFAWVINWVAVVMLFFGLVVVTKQVSRLAEVNDRQYQESVRDRTSLRQLQERGAQDRADIRASLNERLAVSPADVMEEVKAMRAEHARMMDVLTNKKRTATTRTAE